MKQKEIASFLVYLGRRLRELRETHQKRQQDIASAARKCGLPWTRATIAAIEIGRRRLSVEEFLLLPFVFYEAKMGMTEEGNERRLLELFDLFLGDEWVTLTPSTRISVEGVRDILQRKFGEGWLGHYDTSYLRKMRAKYAITRKDLEQERDREEKIFQILPEANFDMKLLMEIEEEMEGDAEQKAARRLKVPLRAIAFTARRVWKHSLTMERDKQVAERTTDNTPPRRVQAIRGHVTRELLNQLRPLVQGLIESKVVAKVSVRA